MRKSDDECEWRPQRSCDSSLGPTYSPGRKHLERCALVFSSMRRKLAALSSLFEYLSEATHIPPSAWGDLELKATKARRRRQPTLTPRCGTYKLVRGYAKKLGVAIGAHVLRATAGNQCARARGGH